MIADPWWWDAEKVRNSNRWYLQHVVFRPKDENGLPLPTGSTRPKPSPKTALLDEKRFWETYIGLRESLDEMMTKLTKERERHAP